MKKKLIEMHAWRQVLDAEVRNRIAVGDKEVEAYYGGHPDEFHVPGDVTLRESVFLADSAHRQARRSEAEAIRAKAAAAGADFAAIAKEFSEAGTKANGGLIGPVKKGELAPALETAAMSLPIGEVSPIIETDYGLYVIKVEARNEDREKPLEDVKEPIRGMLEADRFRIAVADYLHKIWNESEIWIAPKYKKRLSPEPTGQPGCADRATAPGHPVAAPPRGLHGRGGGVKILLDGPGNAGSSETDSLQEIFFWSSGVDKATNRPAPRPRTIGSTIELMTIVRSRSAERSSQR